MVTEYKPAINPEIFCVISPFDQRKLGVGLPPDTIKLITPFELPKHDTSVAVATPSKIAGSVIVPIALAVHPLASVTTTL